MFDNVKLIAIGVGAVILLSIVGTLGWKYHAAIREAETTRANNAKLEAALQTQGATIDQMEGAIVGWRKAQDDLISTMKESSEAARVARDKAKKTEMILAKHNLENLSLHKPALIQKRINAATAKALSGLECASSAQGC